VKSKKVNKLGPDNLGVFVCPHVFDNTRPILYVCRADGDWQFPCGGTDHNVKGHVVGVEHLTERDSTLNDLKTLRPEWQAERENIDSSWVFSECPD